MQLDVKVLDLNPNFTAYDLKTDGVAPWPFYSRYHNIREPDGPDAHDHPFGMHVQIMSGGYEEEIFQMSEGIWKARLVKRETFSSFYIPAHRVHRINQIWGDLWTHVVTGPGVNQWRVFSEKEIRNG